MFLLSPRAENTSVFECYSKSTSLERTIRVCETLVEKIVKGFQDDVLLEEHVDQSGSCGTKCCGIGPEGQCLYFRLFSLHVRSIFLFLLDYAASLFSPYPSVEHTVHVLGCTPQFRLCDTELFGAVSLVNLGILIWYVVRGANANDVTGFTAANFVRGVPTWGMISIARLFRKVLFVLFPLRTRSPAARNIPLWKFSRINSLFGPRSIYTRDCCTTDEIPEQKMINYVFFEEILEHKSTPAGSWIAGIRRHGCRVGPENRGSLFEAVQVGNNCHQGRYSGFQPSAQDSGQSDQYLLIRVQVPGNVKDRLD
ncbi:hypothetical protein P691DRAFT_789035 [Macrolepiota fuliginosa MF-IS2]|uniref:Uncharacterized protein n=1 Tax=Macrolepiota fuliginosa MF-IS2 TaxID=1400762 RepID=A0A9P6BWD3_9AGAR|nr:hypothetical protein P691DRAFT_789035 [Macrolepiota fuliginosa MF-IS2]